MLCDECNNNEATIHFKSIVNDNVTEMHLCETCAKKKGLGLSHENQGLGFGMFDIPFTHSSLPELIAELVDTGHIKGTPGDPRCPNCKLSYSEFKSKGRLGCAKCFDVFAPYLSGLIKKIHGDQTHTGKSYYTSEPASAESRDTSAGALESLKRELASAVKKEEFEKAARLRDEIKKIQDTDK